MKVEELISRLQELQRRHGNLDVYTCGISFKDPTVVTMTTHIDLSNMSPEVAADLRKTGAWIPDSPVILLGGKY